MNEITGITEITGMNACMQERTQARMREKELTESYWEKLWEESIWEAVSGLFS